MKKHIIRLLPILSIGLAVLLHNEIPNSTLQPQAEKPYFTYFLEILLGLYIICVVVSYVSKVFGEWLITKAPLWAGAVLLLNIINLAFSKYAMLPVLYFPCLDRVFEVFVTDYKLLWECIRSSFRLLAWGWLWGAGLGFITGVGIGFNKKLSYWVSPFTKVIGPIPPTSWSPLVLSLFTTSYHAAIFMIALAVWFPITLMTSSGIQNVQNSYFEAASTLGAKKYYRIVHVGIPAAMPHIFLGVFYATCSSFVTLVTAEMLGCKSGIGWYLNWVKSMMLYSKVYAGLIVLAGICTFVLTLIFKMKDKILVWQKGMIKW